MSVFSDAVEAADVAWRTFYKQYQASLAAKTAADKLRAAGDLRVELRTGSDEVVVAAAADALPGLDRDRLLQLMRAAANRSLIMGVPAVVAAMQVVQQAADQVVAAAQQAKPPTTDAGTELL